MPVFYVIEKSVRLILSASVIPSRATVFEYRMINFSNDLEWIVNLL
jgi:hypothetical protein